MKTHRKNTQYTPALGLRLCTRLVNGEALQEICRDESMPSRETVYKTWLKKYPDFAQQFALIRSLQDEKTKHEQKHSSKPTAFENTNDLNSHIKINLTPTQDQLNIAQLACEVIQLADSVDANDPDAIKKIKLQMDARRWYVNWAMLNHWRNQQVAVGVSKPSAQALLPEELQPRSVNDVYVNILEQQMEQDGKDETENLERKVQYKAPQPQTPFP